MANERQNLFKISKTSPELISDATKDLYAMEAIEKLQAIERSYQGHDEVEVRAGNDSIWVFKVGDLHLGAISTDHKAIYELRDQILKTPNAGLVLLGDEIEGLKTEYLNTNTARTPIDVQAQIDILRHSFLEPLAKKGKILAMVSGYWGHPGWIEDATTVNPWIMMTKDLGVPVLVNGGRLKIRFANGHEQSQVIWHNPPSHSEFDAVLGLRKVAQVQSENAERASGYNSGHMHVASVAKENYPGAKYGVYYISSGTAKGSSPDIPPDRFGKKLGRPLADPMGQGEIIMPRRVGKNHDRNYPVISIKHGEVLNNALNLLNRAEQQGITKEITEKILKVAPKPEIKFVEENSITNKSPYDERPKHKIKDDSRPNYNREMLAPQYDSLFYNIKSSLPITVHFIANTRIGSSYEGYDVLKNFLANYVVENPYALTVFLRNMIDKDVATNPDRRERSLDKFARIMGLNNHETLAFMLDESLRAEAWKRDISYSPAIPAGTYLAESTGARIIHHLSNIKIALGPGNKIENKPLYTGVFADKLFHHGSFSRPTYGLRRIYDLYIADKPGYVAGGHMPNSGSMTFFDRGNPETNYPVLLAPGWWADYINSAGKGNVSPGAIPGQAMVFMPGKGKKDYMAFPTTNPDESDYIPKALTILSGIDLLGYTPRQLK